MANNVAWLELLVALNRKPQSCSDLVETTGFTRNTVDIYIKNLRRRKLIYIAMWHKTEYAVIALYSWGYGMQDAIKPKPLTSADYSRRWRTKQATKKEQQDLKDQEAKKLRQHGNKRSSGAIQQDNVGRSSIGGASLSEAIRLVASLSAQEVSESYQDTKGS